MRRSGSASDDGLLRYLLPASTTALGPIRAESRKRWTPPLPGTWRWTGCRMQRKRGFPKRLQTAKSGENPLAAFSPFCRFPGCKRDFPRRFHRIGDARLPLSGDPLRPPIMGLPASPLLRGRRPDRPRPFRAGRPACSPSRRLGRGFFIGKPGSPSAKSVSASRPLPFLFGDKTADKGTARPPNGQDSLSASASSLSGCRNRSPFGTQNAVLRKAVGVRRVRFLKVLTKCASLWKPAA